MDRIGLRAAAPLGREVAVEEVPVEESIVALCLEQVGRDPGQRPATTTFA